MDEPAATTSERKRPRLWHLIVGAIAFFVLALVVALLLARGNGRARWQAFLAAEQAAGRPITMDRIVALTPPVDLGVQGAWQAWSNTYAAAIKSPKTLWDTLRPHRAAWGAWVTGHGPLPTTVSELIANQQTAMAPALVPLRSGKLVLSSSDWVMASSAGRSSSLTPLQIPNYFTIWSLSQWLHHQALMSDDPTQHLADLDALHTAIARPVTLRDTDITIAHGYIRDLTYLELAIQNRLTAGARDRWLAEPCRYVEMIGDGLLSARVQLLDEYAHQLDLPINAFIDSRIRSLGGWRWYIAGDIAIAPWLWAVGHDDLQPIADFMHLAATRLRGEHHDPVPNAWAFAMSLHGISPYLSIPYQLRYAEKALQKDAFHRQIRLAVRILELMRNGGLPNDQAELLARLGNPQALLGDVDRLTLVYERPAPDRFRLAIDPASSVPDFDNPTRLAKSTSAAGSPAATEPLTTESLAKDQFIEIQVPPAP